MVENSSLQKKRTELLVYLKGLADACCFHFLKKNVEMSVDARANKPDGIVSRERENLKNVKMKFWWSSGKCQIAVQKNVEKYE